MYRLWSDVWFTLRLLRRSPGFFATLLGVLIAGIGATTAMFSIVESLLLRPLPYENPDQLTMVWLTQPSFRESPVSVADFLDWKAQATTFERMAATDYSAFSLSSEGKKPEYLSGADVSGDFFLMFGVKPLQGRLLGPEDDRVGGPNVAVISAAVWHRRFGSDPALIGRTISLNSEAFTVVGVAPDGFLFSGPNSDRTDIWTPLALEKGYARAMTHDRGSHFLHVMGRRRAGVTLEQAQVQITTIARGIEAAYPDSNTKVGAKLVGLHDQLVGTSRGGVWVLFGAVALVFLVVCANVANLLLTRAQSRRAEMATRAALGATRGRLAVQLMTETVVVFLIGSLGGAVLSRWLVGLFASGIIDLGGVGTIAVRVDATALLFCVATCLICGALFGLVPAVAVSRVSPHTVLKDSAARAGASRSQQAVRGGLVVIQVALAFALLAGSGLALKAFARVAATPVGFDPENLATLKVVLPERKYSDEAHVVKFFQEVIARVAAEPGVESVAANSTFPMGGSNSSGSFKIEGREEWARGEEPTMFRHSVSPGYFATMKIPILSGREFTEADRSDGRKVMVLSQSAANQFFPGQDPIGRRIDWGTGDDPEWREIVGIAGDVRRRGPAFPVDPASYAPFAQAPVRWMMVAARTPRAEALLKELPAMVQTIDPDQATAGQRLMTDRIATSIGSQRYVTMLLFAFAAAALLLATLGVFGLVSYSTSQRTRELGIRMALGSTPEAVVRLVMRGGLRLVGLGLGFGLVGALLVGRLLANRIVGVVPFDTQIYLAIPAILGIAGLLACLLPAWRAVRIPPAIALRYE